MKVGQLHTFLSLPALSEKLLIEYLENLTTDFIRAYYRVSGQSKLPLQSGARKQAATGVLYASRYRIERSRGRQNFDKATHGNLSTGWMMLNALITRKGNAAEVYIVNALVDCLQNERYKAGVDQHTDH